MATTTDLVLCVSPDGWSLHAPGSTADAIATGDAPYLVSGDGHPTDADYADAMRVLRGAQSEPVAHGLTLVQWLAAAGRSDTASEYDLRAAWRAGEDPTRYAR